MRSLFLLACLTALGHVQASVSEVQLATVLTGANEVTISYVAATDPNGSFQLIWKQSATATAAISATQYAGLGFQNDVSADATNLNMYGPSGTDFFTMQIGSVSNKGYGKSFYLPASTSAGSGAGKTPDGPVDSLSATVPNPDDDNRIRSVTDNTVSGVRTYTMTVKCQKAGASALGSTDFSKPVAVLYAVGGANSNQILLHSARGRVQNAQDASLRLFTLCPEVRGLVITSQGGALPSSSSSSSPSTSSSPSSSTTSATTSSPTNTSSTTAAPSGRGAQSSATTLSCQFVVALTVVLLGLALL